MLKPGGVTLTIPPAVEHSGFVDGHEVALLDKLNRKLKVIVPSWSVLGAVNTNEIVIEPPRPLLD
jgi:hypothetical protein